MSALFRDLARSPIVLSFVAFAALSAFLFWLVGYVVMNDVLDSMAIAGCIMVLVRFGVFGFESIRQRKPTGANVLVVSTCLLMISIGGLRFLREVGLDFGLLSKPITGYIFGALTTVMVFAIFAKVASPQLTVGSLKFKPIPALFGAMAMGVIACVTVIVLRHWLRGG